MTGGRDISYLPCSSVLCAPGKHTENNGRINDSRGNEGSIDTSEVTPKSSEATEGVRL